MINKRFQLFISYSHNNNDLKMRLDTHLESLRNEMKIDIWSDAQIQPGEKWYWEITNELKNSSLILLLLSPDYIASQNCKDEMQKALELHDSEKKYVVPIYLQTCAFETLPITNLQLCPIGTDNRPLAVDAWDNKDTAFNEIRKKLKPIVEDIQGKIDNTDIDCRVEEILSLLALNELKLAINRLIDFVRQFTKSKIIMFKACAVSGIYNRMEQDLNGKQLNDTQWKVYKDITDEIAEIVTLVTQPKI